MGQAGPPLLAENLKSEALLPQISVGREWLLLTSVPKEKDVCRDQAKGTFRRERLTVHGSPEHMDLAELPAGSAAWSRGDSVCGCSFLCPGCFSSGAWSIKRLCSCGQSPSLGGWDPRG